MKPKINIQKNARNAWSFYNLPAKGLIIGAFIIAGFQAPLQAQETQDVQYTRPSWYFGAAAGANFNFFEGSTHKLNNDFTPPAVFHDGRGIGLFVAPLIEYHRPDTRLGFMFQAGYDSRKGDFKQVTAPCNCPADLTTDLSYITVEPSLRFAPFKSNFYLYGGPRFAFNMTKAFTYEQAANPANPEQVAPADVKGDFSDISETQISMQIGAGVDIPLSSTKRHTQFMLSPFVSFQPYIGQIPRTIETWNITTVRAGTALKFGRGRKIETPKKEEVIPAAIVEPEVKFTVNAPNNIPAERNVREVFPVRNYVFFDLGSNEIPSRYVLLKKDQVKDFREEQLESDAPQTLAGRSDRQMVVYYNILNILGDRMVKNPTTTIQLVGSSEKGPADGKEMAESVKEYLVTIFAIDAKRITTSGRTKPVIAGEQPGGTRDLVLLREGDRRVTIESSSPVLLMEFTSGPDAPLKPVEILTVQKAPLASYISFTVEGEEEAFTSWSLELTDDKGIVKNFGPYTEETVSIPSNAILGSRPEGDYKVVMIGQTKSGKEVRKETKSHMVLWTPSTSEEAMRFSVIYEFNRSKATSIYEKYILDVVTPKIPVGGMVIINGYTDITGGEDNNLKLSLARANDVKAIIEKGLKKAGRTDVKFQLTGLGEDEKTAPFENKFPEERFYNRTVVIDLIPLK